MSKTESGRRSPRSDPPLDRHETGSSDYAQASSASERCLAAVLRRVVRELHELWPPTSDREIGATLAHAGFTYVLVRVPCTRADALSERQREVAVLAGEGLALKEIARRLGVGRPCVAKHLQRVYEKLRVDSRAALARRTFVLGEALGARGDQGAESMVRMNS